MQFDRLQTKTAFLLSFRCFCTLRKVSKKGSQNPEIGNFAGADFKRRMRRLQFPRAAFDFSACGNWETSHAKKCAILR